MYEEYNVVTDDGYVLGLYRIPGVKGQSQDEQGVRGRPPVLLMHGLWFDMMAWVVNGNQSAPAYVLARAGYDVWLGNHRGVRNSERHVFLDPETKEYWNFSWEEYGTRDLPAFINFIKTTTGFSKVNYIGHSAGTSGLLAGASLKPEFFN